MQDIRIQKFFSELGICSRRKTEEYIIQKRVKVNGRFAKIGQKVNYEDVITLDNKKLELNSNSKKKYVVMYKPRGYICTLNDEKNRKSVMDILKNYKYKLKPVGRLDRNSEGLLIFTNDGDFHNSLLKPSLKIKKVYTVKVKPNISEEQFKKLSEIKEIDNIKILPFEFEFLFHEGEKSVLKFTLLEGKNRQIRKMCELVNLNIVRLKRVSIGTLTLKGLKYGEYRELTFNEVRQLKNLIKI